MIRSREQGIAERAVERILGHLASILTSPCERSFGRSHDKPRGSCSRARRRRNGTIDLR